MLIYSATMKYPWFPSPHPHTNINMAQNWNSHLCKICWYFWLLLLRLGSFALLSRLPNSALVMLSRQTDTFLLGKGRACNWLPWLTFSALEAVELFSRQPNPPAYISGFLVQAGLQLWLLGLCCLAPWNSIGNVLYNWVYSHLWQKLESKRQLQVDSGRARIQKAKCLVAGCSKIENSTAKVLTSVASWEKDRFCGCKILKYVRPKLRRMGCSHLSEAIVSAWFWTQEDTITSVTHSLPVWGFSATRRAGTILFN